MSVRKNLRPMAALLVAVLASAVAYAEWRRVIAQGKGNLKNGK